MRFSVLKLSELAALGAFLLGTPYALVADVIWPPNPLIIMGVECRLLCCVLFWLGLGASVGVGCYLAGYLTSWPVRWLLLSLGWPPESLDGGDHAR